MQVCLFKKFEDEDRARLSWIGVGGLESGRGRGRGGRTRSGSSKSSPHHLGRWAGFSAENFPQLVCERAGTGGELLSGMQGPSPQGETAKGTKSPSRTKSFGAVPIGGRSKWAGTGTWASRLAHPSCTVGADLEGKDQGSDCEEMQRSNTPKKRASHQRDRPSEGCTAARNHWGSHAATLAASHAPTTFGISRLPPSPSTSPSTYESKCLEGSAQKPGEAWPGTPRAHQRVACLSSAAVRMPKNSPLRHPSHSTASSDIPDTTTCVQTDRRSSAVVRPPGTAVAVLGNLKGQERAILTALVTVHGFGFFL